MDDDLLADDGQYKDDGLDDLDIDAEAALLGLSDEEIEDDRSQTDDQELEYVDEDGNPVSIGENNADQYEVANIESDKLSNQPDEDVLELDLDTELDSFNQETDLRDSPTPNKSYKERQRKDNLISLTNRKEPEKPPPRRKESRYSPEDDRDRFNKDVSFTSQSSSSRIERQDSYSAEFEYDEESEDEGIADDHRERFKSERSNIITLTPAKRRADIPDTLESVISIEETAKVQAFLENEQKKKMRFKGKMHGRGKPAPRFQRPPQNFNAPPAQHSQFQHSQQSQFSHSPQSQFPQSQQSQFPQSQQSQFPQFPQSQQAQFPQAQQPPPFSSSSALSASQPVSNAAQPRKILINPHFRGVRIPPPTESVHPVNEVPPQASLPPPSSYEPPPSNFPPPVQYSHQETIHPVSVAPPPIYTAPPPTVQYKHPDYPPQQPLQQNLQMPPPTWQQAPDVTVQHSSYSVPPPAMNYGEPMPQPPNYNNYNQNYQNTNYQNPPMPMPQSVNYSQPPPPVHHYSQSFPTPPVNPVSTNMAHTQYSPAPSQIRMQTSVQAQHYQDISVSPLQVSSHTQQKPKFMQNTQRFSRPPEKRLSNTNFKHLPMKQARLEHPPRKTNLHVNSSNIREIPLVDTLPAIRKTTAIKTVPIVEEEDEKTRELRMKIEEQKLLRQQILKRKEERRRQMAAQRLSELKKRQGEQGKNTVTIIPKAGNINQAKGVAAAKPVVKPSVKERIGAPLNKNLPATKKKIVVVRKKAQQDPVAPASNNVAKPPAIVGQRLKLPVPSQRQTSQPNQQIIKPATSNSAQQNNFNKVTPTLATKPVVNIISKGTAPVKETENKPQVTVTNQKKQQTSQPKKIVLNSPALRGKTIRLGNRIQFQKQSFSPMQRLHRPRVPGPRGRQFPSFVEPRMPFHNRGPPPMNDIRMHPPPFQDPRPPLLPFHPRREPGPFFPRDLQFEPSSPPFHMRGPGLPNFRPRMEPMFRDRFPPPQFRNQMPPMRHIMDNNMHRFQRPRFHQQGKPRFNLNNNVSQKSVNESKTAEAKQTTVAPTSKETKPNQKPTVASNINEVKTVTKVLTRNLPKDASDDKNIPKTQVVSVENLSSSTSEAQLRKLCSTVGVVETIQLLKSERKAVIKFKQPSQALNFQKKYQSKKYPIKKSSLRNFSQAQYSSFTSAGLKIE